MKRLNDKIKESKFCSKVIETEFNKPIVMNEKDYVDFKNSTKCWICKKIYKKDEVKVKDQDHISEKHRECTHREYNINLTLKTISKTQNYH